MTRRLHIAQLVLPAGVVGRQRVREALEHELARLDRTIGPPPEADGRRVAQAQGEVSPASDARTLGRAAAAAAHAALQDR